MSILFINFFVGQKVLISMIKCYVINLKRRKDRLKSISLHLKSLGFNFKRFEAIDAKKASLTSLMKNMNRFGPLGELSIGDRACFQSHFKLWEKIAIYETLPVLVLEDDVRLTKPGINLLKNISWISNDINIIKCERFGNKRHRILVRPIRKINDLFSINHLLSKHSGTGGYIITPKGAKFLIDQKTKVSVSVDHYLFNPNNSLIFNQLKPLQLLPVICEQIDSHSDIHPSRSKFNFFSFWDFFREVIRGYYEIKLIPKQLIQLIFTNAKIIKPQILD